MPKGLGDQWLAQHSLPWRATDLTSQDIGHCSSDHCSSSHCYYMVDATCILHYLMGKARLRPRAGGPDGTDCRGLRRRDRGGVHDRG